MTNGEAIRILQDTPIDIASTKQGILGLYAEALDMAIEALSAQPEIIRCKDCDYWDMSWQNDWAKNYHYCPLIDDIRNGNWYCADAERKDNETD